MVLRTLKAFAFLVLLPTVLFSQPLKPGEWRSYTSMRTVQDIAMSGDSTMVWVATTGGAFGIDLRNGNAITPYRTTDGLSENDVVSVATDSHGHTFFGERNGGFDVLGTSLNKIQQRVEIRTQPGLTQRTINSLYTSGTRVYLSTAFGLSIYTTQGAGYFVTAVSRIADLPQGDSVLGVVEANGRLYLAMNEGVASAPMTAELTIPSVWSLAHLPAHPNSIVRFNGEILVGTDSGVFRLMNDTLTRVESYGAVAVLDLASGRDSLFVLGSDRVLRIGDLTGNRTEDLSRFKPTTVEATSDGFAIVGTEQNGVYFETPLGWSDPIFPGGPVRNDVSDLIFVEDKGELFASNGSYGLSAFHADAGTWQDYAVGAELPRASYERLVYDPVRNVTWASCFGQGAYKIRDFGEPSLSYEWINDTNGLAPQTQGTFIVAGDGIIDRDGRYCVSLWAANGRGLACTSDGETFTSYQLAPSSDLGISWGCVTQDHEGNFWVGTQHSDLYGRGLFWSRQSDHAFGSIPGGPGLDIENRNINALLTDQDDGIWLGTEGGVQILSNPYAIDQVNPKFYIRTVKLLDQQVTHAIAVDGVGNKWIATERGIFVVSPDGTDSVAHFSTDNSPLIDDRVFAITIDQQRGEVYAGTPSGISRFSTVFTAGKADYTGIHVYPNPLVQTSEASPEVTIDGLVAGSTVKVFTLNGKLVATINGTNLGSTVKWDGRDSNGRVVTSGLYLITATSPSSGDNGEAKLVIVRQ